MTTKTGSTEMRLEPTAKGPKFSLAMLGACTQLGTLYYVWGNHTSAGPCLKDPLSCLPFSGRADVDPWGRLATAVFAFALVMWVVSLRGLVGEHGTSDPSIVDRLWSLMPWIYVLVLCTYNLNPRLILMACCSTIWGVRLTYNFWKKGGFSGGEDYRWPVIRKWFPGWRWEVFNLVFICCFQQMAILGFVTPAVAAMQSQAPLAPLDYVAAALYMVLWVGETVADAQMFAYQTEKYRRRNAGEEPGPYHKGFIDTGLWAWSRHPNYFCEVSMWWAFYLFSISATGQVLNWTIWGAVFLTGLFVPPGASADLTEMLSSSKYPLYKDYQKRVSRFVPWFPKSKAS